jgi:hypothetical protein
VLIKAPKNWEMVIGDIISPMQVAKCEFALCVERNFRTYGSRTESATSSFLQLYASRFPGR